jgi:prevent-host-death family protein
MATPVLTSLTRCFRLSVMNSDQYSTYQAKARFAEVLRKVREGRTVTITYHGEPVAELRPIRRAEGLEARLEWLRARGRIAGGASVRGKLVPLAKRRGALRRFLEDREA